MIIKTKQFILRPFKMSDAKDLSRNISDRAIIRNLMLSIYPYKLKHATGFIKRKLMQYKLKKHTDYAWAIEIDGEVAGSIGLHHIVYGHKADIGYWLAKKHWGQGIMTKVVKLVSDFAFKKYKLKRISARVYLYNPGSKRVLEKAGFQVEGILRKDVLKDKKCIDAYILAKIKR